MSARAYAQFIARDQAGFAQTVRKCSSTSTVSSLISIASSFALGAEKLPVGIPPPAQRDLSPSPSAAANSAGHIFINRASATRVICVIATRNALPVSDHLRKWPTLRHVAPVLSAPPARYQYFILPTGLLFSFSVPVRHKCLHCLCLHRNNLR